MHLRHLLIAVSLTVALGGAATAAPLPVHPNGLDAPEAGMALAKSKHRGHAYGHRKWRRDRGLHRGWNKNSRHGVYYYRMRC